MMKVIFDKEQLLSSVKYAAGISQIKNTLTNVDGLLFECPPDPRMGEYDGEEKNVCRISAFDLEKGIRMTVGCNIFTEGKYIINGQRLLQIISSLPDGEITLEVNSNLVAKITSGEASFELPVFEGEQFAVMPQFKGEKSYVFPQYVIKNMIKQSIFAAAQNDQRMQYNGELFKIKDGKLTITGCDGNRLSCLSYDMTAETGKFEKIDDCELIIPSQFLRELEKMLRDSDDDVEMILGSKHIIFKIDKIFFFCRMIEGKYLEYERILPTLFESEVYVSPTDLRSALQRAAIISEEKGGKNDKPAVKIKFMSDRVEVSSVSTSGSVFDRIPAAMTGKEMTIGFNCRFLLDVLNEIPEELHRLRIGLIGPEKGVAIEPYYGSSFIKVPTTYEKEDKEEKRDFLHYVMPTKLFS